MDVTVHTNAQRKRVRQWESEKITSVGLQEGAGGQKLSLQSISLRSLMLSS